MSDPTPDREQPPAPPAVDPAVRCSECGVPGAIDFAGLLLCPRCYSEKGSCCPEFGKDDLWRDREP